MELFSQQRKAVALTGLVVLKVKKRGQTQDIPGIYRQRDLLMRGVWEVTETAKIKVKRDILE